MKRFFRNRFFRVVFIIISAVFILTQCINREKEKKEPGTGKSIEFESFAGSAKCAPCHQDIYNQHIQTPHFLTSTLPEEKYIKGSFENAKNRYAYNASVVVVMEKRDSGLYQVVYSNGVEKIALPFSMVVGSGAKGQTYVHRRENRFFQLPISYFTVADQWSNSPGFPSHTAVVNRPITSRCLECHATYAEMISAPDIQPEEFDHQKILYGVDCEKCHGPAASHIEFHTQNPKDTTGKYIIDPGTFNRQQILDLCALCHGGKMTKLKPSFEFIAGNNLSEYFIADTLDPRAVSYGSVDVHGNQYGLLKASKCFTISKTMTCNSCHDPHENERGNIEVFSQRCISCHSPSHENFCKMRKTLGPAITSNCIDCHMPKQRSMAIALQLPGQEVPQAALVRSHFISIYPEETRKFNSDSSKSTGKRK